MQADSFYTNPRLTALFMLFVVVLGGVAFAGLARQEDPSMAERYARVNTFLPGASAARVESLISEPLETSLREIPEIKKIFSTSKSGISVVSIELLDRISPEDTQNVWSEVRDQLGTMQGSLPRGTVESDLMIQQPVASTMIIALSWRHSSDIEMSILSRLAESLRLQLANMSGTEKAESWGEAEEEIVVSLDPNRMVASGLFAAFIAQRINAADTKIASGRLRAGGNDILVEVNADLDSVERIASIPLVTNSNGSTIRVSDLASVRKTQLDPPRSLAFHGTEQVIFVNAQMQAGLQIENWTRKANATRCKIPSQPTGVNWLRNCLFAKYIYRPAHEFIGQQSDLCTGYCAAGAYLAHGHSLRANGGHRPAPFRQHGAGGHAGVRHSAASNVGHRLDYFVRPAH